MNYTESNHDKTLVPKTASSKNFNGDFDGETVAVVDLSKFAKTKSDLPKASEELSSDKAVNGDTFEAVSISNTSNRNPNAPKIYDDDEIAAIRRQNRGSYFSLNSKSAKGIMDVLYKAENMENNGSEIGNPDFSKF